MSKTIAYVALMLSAAVVVVCALAAPNLLGDTNEFLKGFINQELLAVLAVILSITLASIAQIHLEFNKIEERYNRRNSLVRTRQGVRTSSLFLIFLFLAAMLVVVIKPLLATKPWIQTIFNGTGLIILIWNILILTDLIITIFSIRPIIKDD